MRRLAVLVVALPLAGCGVMTPTVDSEAVAVVVAQVQAAAVKICSFLPTDGTVVEIVKATQGGETVLAIANAICKAVTASPTVGALGGNTAPCPVVAGVCVEGQFIDPKEYEKIQDDPIPNETAPAPAPEQPAPPPAEGAPQQ